MRAATVAGIVMGVSMRYSVAALLGATALVGISAQSASAADMPAKAPALVYTAPYSWTGLYIGGHVGAVWSSGDSRWDPLPDPVAFGADTIRQSLKDTSFAGGLHIGYNYMFMPAWVAGIEADWTWTDNNASETTRWTIAGAPLPPGEVTTMSRKIEWLSTIRGRIGYAVMPQALLYATGGFAFGHVKYDASARNGGPYNVAFSDRTTKTGYALGGGLEWALTNNWLLRGEYLFYHLGSESGTATSTVLPAFPSGFNWDSINIHTARLGLSYKF